MQTQIIGSLRATAAGATAEAVIGACVHCGMCNAACPTYRLTGDELDGPRGRIYLMKQALEGEPVGELTQFHLDRCLACRACESACPSGVEYHRLLDVGRGFVSERVQRSRPQRLARRALRLVAEYPWILTALFAVGRTVGFALPRTLAEKVPTARPAGPWPRPRHARRVLLLGGCVQSAAAGHFNAATARVLDQMGISAVESRGCCGALFSHLDADGKARAVAKRHLDAWDAALSAGCEAIVINASGCAAFVRDWPDLLADEPLYAEKARRVVSRLKDPIEMLDGVPFTPRRGPAAPRIAVHDPCTLRNGRGLAGAVETLLTRMGYQPQFVAEPSQCCGSAGAYSLLQPEFAHRLRTEKMASLIVGEPDAIYTANIGCWMHLAAVSPVPVRHWIEAVDDLISGP
jgi:glycolate oxidase iron-sulfur subunit